MQNINLNCIVYSFIFAIQLIFKNIFQTVFNLKEHQINFLI
jgi:hypothetical protein